MSLASKSQFHRCRLGALSLLLLAVVAYHPLLVQGDSTERSSSSKLRGLVLSSAEKVVGSHPNAISAEGMARRLEDDNEDPAETLDEEEAELGDELENLEEEEFEMEEEELEAEEELADLEKDDELLGDVVDPENKEEEEELEDELEELEMELDEVHDEEEVVIDLIDEVEEEKQELAEESQEDEFSGNVEDEPEPDKATEKPTSSYSPPADDPIAIQDEEIVEQVEEELAKEEKIAREAGGFGFFLAIGGMIFTAHQMSENPDGLYASLCRLAITITGVVVKIICMPCRKLIGASGNSHYTGHMPISTVDYGYKGDSGFEMR